jgi:protein-S-isoprenylcysteine O-methyltransferase Ste14
MVNQEGLPNCLIGLERGFCGQPIEAACSRPECMPSVTARLRRPLPRTRSPFRALPVRASGTRERIGAALHARCCSLLLFTIGFADPHGLRQREFGDPRVMRKPMIVLLKSLLHNIGVVIVGLALAYLGTMVDLLLGAPTFASAVVRIIGSLLLTLGFLLRVWATTYFYAHSMRVISLQPQNTLITSGPYRFSRNPLYLGGNVFIFFGAALALGSPTALVATALHLPLMDRFIQREEGQLERQFGQEWRNYKERVRRWL